MTTATTPLAPAATGSRAAHRAWRVFASVLAFATLTWGSVQLVALLAHGEDHVRHNFSAAGLRTIVAAADNGTIRVITEDRDDVLLTAYVSESLGGTDSSVHRVGDRLVVNGECNFDVGPWCRTSYTLRVPRALDLDLHAGDGEVLVVTPRGTQYRVHTTTGEGNVSVSVPTADDARHSIVVTTGDGDITIRPRD
ncbi:MAG: hypothetical protein U0W40_16685 [Acidimicrobiia bacterium]